MSGRIEVFNTQKEPTSKWSQNEAFQVREAGVDIGKTGGQGGSNVSVDQVVTSGREVAGVTVDGQRTAILVPNEGSFVQSDWDENDPSEDAYIKNKPALATVATSGSYDDLSDKPDLSNFVSDPNYVHTDYNYDLGAKTVVDGVTTALANKVDKVQGKVLSDNNFTNAQKDKLTNLANIYGVGTGLQLDQQTNILSATAPHIDVDSAMSSTSENPVQNKVITGALADKVDKVSGKVLSDNNFSNADKQKLDGIDQGAEVNDISTISVNGVNVPADANKNVEISVPVKVSDLTNDSGFITNTVNNLTNYYLKSDTYTQAEVNTLIAAITTLNIEVVNTLPVSSISTTTIYLVPKATASTQDVYDEWINIDGTSSGWEHIGDTEVDLTNYYTKTETDTLLASKANTSDIPTATSDLTNDSNFVADANYVHTDNNYTTPEKTKLSGLENYSDTVQDITWDEWNALTPTQAAGNEYFITDEPFVSGKINTEIFTKLWENPNPTSAFAAQTINLSSDDYDFLLWVMKYTGGDTYTYSEIASKGSEVLLRTTGTTAQSYTLTYQRVVSRVSDTEYSIGQNYGQAGNGNRSVDNTFNYPLAVYGFKKTVSFDFSALVANVSTEASKCMLNDGRSVEQATTWRSLGQTSGNAEITIPNDVTEVYARAVATNSGGGSFTFRFLTVEDDILDLGNGFYTDSTLNASGAYQWIKATRKASLLQLVFASTAITNTVITKWYGR